MDQYKIKMLDIAACKGAAMSRQKNKEHVITVLQAWQSMNVCARYSVLGKSKNQMIRSEQPQRCTKRAGIPRVPYRLLITSLAATTPDIDAWMSPRETPAPSPAAKRFFTSVSKPCVSFNFVE